LSATIVLPAQEGICSFPVKICPRNSERCIVGINWFIPSAKALDTLEAGTYPVGHPHVQQQSLNLQCAGDQVLLQDSSSRALYLFQLKALEQDQPKPWRNLSLCLPRLQRPSMTVIPHRKFETTAS
jgi:hypothetical protein